VRYGILGDIHGNLEALTAALNALDRIDVDRVVCLGDIVGYNADSNACAALVQRRGIESIAGNHDLISIGRLTTDKCANKAAFALERTRRVLKPETRSFLSSLPQTRIYETRLLLIHGGIGDVEQYIYTSEEVRLNVYVLRRCYPQIHVCFFGHTHEPKVYEVDGDDLVAELPARGTVPLSDGRRYFINPGSVDAARKRESRLAEFGVFDSSRRRMEFHQAAYDYLEAEMKAAGEGYRINADAVTDLFYSARRRVVSAWTDCRNALLRARRRSA